MSSDIDFQNGFLCGMATRGLSKIGKLYEPLVWNDEGIYDYFYIDFKRSMADFSQGMLSQSIIVHDSMQLSITGVNYVSPGIYKIYCDLSNKTHGITIINKSVSLLKFADGVQVSPFSIHMYILGIVSYLDVDYCYDKTTFIPVVLNVIESFSESLWDLITIDGIYENASFILNVGLSTNETVTVNLT